MLVIGRNSSCDLVVADQRVSARHAELAVSGETLEIRDLNSSNGTFVNDRRVEGARLARSDSVRLGSLPVDLFALLDQARPGWDDEPPAPPQARGKGRVQNSRASLRRVPLPLWVALAVLLILGVGLTASYSFSHRKHRELLAEIEGRRDSFSDSRKQLGFEGAAPVIDFAAAERHLATVEASLPNLRKRTRLLVSGDGMLFWHRGRRRDEAASYEKRLDEERIFADALAAAVESLRPTHMRLAPVVEQSRKARVDVLAGLRVEADDRDLRALAAQVGPIASSLEPLLESIRETRRATAREGRAPRLFDGLLNGLAAAVESETAETSRLSDTLAVATTQLREHKRAIRELVRQEGGAVADIDGLVGGLFTVVDVAHRLAQPVEKAILAAQQPLGTAVMEGLGDLLKGNPASLAGMTTLRLIDNLHPGAAETVDLIKAICETVDVLHERTRTIAEATGPFERPKSEFLRTGSRASQLAMVSGAPSAQELLGSVLTNLDVLIDYSNSLDEQLVAMRSAVSELPAETVADILVSLVGKTQELADWLSRPVREQRARVATASTSLKRIVQAEADYRSRIEQLRAAPQDI